MEFFKRLGYLIMMMIMLFILGIITWTFKFRIPSLQYQLKGDLQLGVLGEITDDGYSESDDLITFKFRQLLQYQGFAACPVIFRDNFNQSIRFETDGVHAYDKDAKKIDFTKDTIALYDKLTSIEFMDIIIPNQNKTCVDKVLELVEKWEIGTVMNPNPGCPFIHTCSDIKRYNLANMTNLELLTKGIKNYAKDALEEDETGYVEHTFVKLTSYILFITQCTGQELHTLALITTLAEDLNLIPNQSNATTDLPCLGAHNECLDLGENAFSNIKWTITKYQIMLLIAACFAQMIIALEFTNPSIYNCFQGIRPILGNIPLINAIYTTSDNIEDIYGTRMNSYRDSSSSSTDESHMRGEFFTTSQIFYINNQRRLQKSKNKYGLIISFMIQCLLLIITCVTPEKAMQKIWCQAIKSRNQLL